MISCYRLIHFLSPSVFTLRGRSPWSCAVWGTHWPHQVAYLPSPVSRSESPHPFCNSGSFGGFATKISHSPGGKYVYKAIVLLFHLSYSIFTFAKLLVANCTFLRAFFHLHIHY